MAKYLANGSYISRENKVQTFFFRVHWLIENGCLNHHLIIVKELEIFGSSEIVCQLCAEIYQGNLTKRNNCLSI